MITICWHSIVTILGWNTLPSLVAPKTLKGNDLINPKSLPTLSHWHCAGAQLWMHIISCGPPHFGSQ